MKALFYILVLASALAVIACEDGEAGPERQPSATITASEPVSETTASTPTRPGATIAPVCAADEKLYVDPLGRFAICYPSVLTAIDTSGNSSRAVQFSDPSDQLRGFSVATLDNSAKLTLDEWFQEFNACVPGEQVEETMVSGGRALTCTANVLGDILEETVAFEGASYTIVYISSTLDEETLSDVLASFEVGP